MPTNNDKTPHKDQRYIKAMRTNNDALIEEAYKLCITQLKSFVLKNSGNLSDAEDLHQEAFLKLCDKANNNPEFILYIPFCKFYRVIYSRKWLSILKKNGKELVIKSEFDESIYETNAEQLAGELSDDEVKFNKLDEAFSKLDDRCKKLLNLKYPEELSAKEIAKQLNLTVSNVNKSMSDCRGRLLKLINNLTQNK